MQRSIELLSPARNLECGIEAIRHGADAVYIGGPAYGARAAAGNSIEDIATLCRYAHTFGAKVYVTANTILTDSELSAAEKMAWQLHDAGVDALIVQDMAFLKLHLPPGLALHASTQMDNRTPDKARLLEAAGFEQIVVARELSLSDIAAIHKAVSVPIEAFVHGALCVSYSGRCYASQHCFSRSANRGECAQFCRLAFELLDAEGNIIRKDKHLLSLRDMNRSDHLETMMDAGVSSFKIEGRLKDVAYVKNITAHYRRRIDEILQRRTEYRRSSYGTTQTTFTPQPEKSFNRGFTDYFLNGRTSDLFSFDTPKAIGEYVGTVGRIDGRTLTVRPATKADGNASVEFTGGDGLCFFNRDGRLQGFRVNRADGMRLSLADAVSELYPGATLYRNTDHAFERLLAHPSAVRTLQLDIALSETPSGYLLSMTDETGRTASLEVEAEKQEGKTPQRDNILRQLGKLGATDFTLRHVRLDLEGNPFIPSSRLAQWRRECLDKLTAQPIPDHRESAPTHAAIPHAAIPQTIDYTGNVANRLARSFYEENGATTVAPAYELSPAHRAELMRCRHCLRHALGHCPRITSAPLPWKEPLRLRLSDGRTFPLRFDCQNCEMVVLAPI